jgi:hypothetical protein
VSLQALRERVSPSERKVLQWGRPGTYSGLWSASEDISVRLSTRGRNVESVGATDQERRSIVVQVWAQSPCNRASRSRSCPAARKRRCAILWQADSARGASCAPSYRCGQLGVAPPCTAAIAAGTRASAIPRGALERVLVPSPSPSTAVIAGIMISAMATPPTSRPRRMLQKYEPRSSSAADPDAGRGKPRV